MAQIITKDDAEQAAASQHTARFSAPYADVADALNIAEFGIAPGALPEEQRGVLIETSHNSVTFNTFDHQVAVAVTLPGATPQAPGQSLFHFKQLTNMLAAAMAGETKAVAARATVSIDADLLATEYLTTPITPLDINAFATPLDPVPAVITVDAQALIPQLDRVLPAAGRDDTLPALTGVQMVLDGQTLTLAATDRYRFAVAEIPTTHATLPKPLTALIPSDTLTALSKRLKRHDGPVGIGIIEGNPGDVARVTLTIGNATITVRPLEGKIPAYGALFPTESHIAVRLDRAAALKATKKTLALFKAKGEKNLPGTFAWSADGTLTLTPRTGAAEVQARTKGTAVPHAITLGNPEDLPGNIVQLHPRFLQDALGAFAGDTVTMHIRQLTGGQTAKPVLFTDGPEMAGRGYRHLLMPVRMS